ncbi:hypothetical protein ACWGJ2_10220 [Streptomyces sp. NPDC054796]
MASRTGTGTAQPLRAAGWVLLGLAGATVLVAGFVVAWRHVRFSPGLVDEWPGGAVGFGLTCAVAALVGWSGSFRLAARGLTSDGSTDGADEASADGSPVDGKAAHRRDLAGAVCCVVLGVTGLLYGLAVVPPRWCYQSLSPRCDSLPGAAEAGIAFLGTLIVVFFANGAVAALLERLRERSRELWSRRRAGAGAAAAARRRDADRRGTRRVSGS